MRIRVQFRAAEALRSIEVIFRQASDVAPVLRRWGGWLRKDADQHFEQQPGWAPLAQSTQERLDHTRTAKVTARGTVRKSYERAAGQQILARLRKGAINADTQLAELRRLSRGGSAKSSLQDGTRRYSKALESLRKQLDRARTTGKRQGGDKRASEKHSLLGKLRKSIMATAKGASVVVESRVPWAGVHNQGGGAGKGAQIPARTFLEITQEGAAALAEIALDHFLGGGR